MRLPDQRLARARLRHSGLQRVGVAVIGASLAVLLLFALIGRLIRPHQMPAPLPPASVADVRVVAPQPQTPPTPELPAVALRLPGPPPPGPPALPAAQIPAITAPSVAAPSLQVAPVGLPVDIGGGSLFGSGAFGGFAGNGGDGGGGGGGGNGEGFGTAADFKGHLLIPLSTARPQMPEWACKQHIKGWVEAAFIVDKRGNVHDVRIIDAQPRGVFEQAAIQSIAHWIYPEQDHPVEVKQRVEMDPADCRYNWQ